ncbi:hypothetical protein [Actinomadura sp. 9N407]|uniref:hypothetical protein n=1 Tax=Actinomadura sp. 9N407 TaxID=3375154 RepID=UPI00378B8470
MSGRTIKAAAAALVAAVALAGCGGGPLKMGAAALVGDDRIAVSTLDTAVTDWQREFRADPVANQLRSDPRMQDQRNGSEPLTESDLRDALDMLVYFRIGDEVARRNGVTVSQGQIDQIVAALEQRGGADSLVRSRGLPARHARDLAKVIGVETLVAQKYGASPDPRAAEQNAGAQRQTARQFVETAEGMKIRVNPRFGSFEPAKIAITPVKYTLSATESGIR